MSDSESSESSTSSASTVYDKDIRKCPGCKHVGYDGGFNSCEYCGVEYCEYCAEEKKEKEQSLWCDRCGEVSGVKPNDRYTSGAVCQCCKQDDKLRVEKRWVECSGCSDLHHDPEPCTHDDDSVSKKRSRSPSLDTDSEDDHEPPVKPVYKEVTVVPDSRVKDFIPTKVWATALKQALEGVNETGRKFHQAKMAEYKEELAKWEAKREKKKQRK